MLSCLRHMTRSADIHQIFTPFRKIKSVGRVAILALVMVLCSCGGEQAENDTSLQNLRQAEAYMKSGQYRAAMIEARNAIQTAPNQQGGYIALAKISNELGGYNHAIKQLESLKGATGGDYIYTLTRAYIGRNKFLSAERFLDEQQAEAKKSDPLQYEVVRGDIAAGQSKFDVAIKHYNSALGLSKNYIPALLGLANIYDYQKNAAEFAKVLAKIDALEDPSAEVYAFKAKQAFAKNDLETSERMLTEALALLPSSDLMTPLRAGVMGLLSEVLTRSGRSAEALVYTRILAEAFPGAELTRGKYKDAIALFDNGDLDGAEKKLLEVLEQAPGNERASQLLGVVKYMQGDLESASEYFEGNLDTELASDKLQQVYAMTNMRLNKPKEVLGLLEGTIDTTKSVETLGLYGLAALSAGEEDKGVKALNRALEIDPKRARIHLALAGYYNTKSPADMKQALEHVKKAYDATPDDPFVQKALIQQYLQMQQVADAKSVVDELLVKYKESHASHILAGNFADLQDDSEQALKHYKQAEAIAPNDAAVLEALGTMYLKLGRWSSAEETFKSYLEAAPKRLMGYKGLMFAANQLGRLDTAINFIASWNEGRETELTEPFIVLGQHFARTGQFEKARAYHTKASDINPEDGMVRRLNAAINYSEGVRAKANNELDKARAFAFAGLKSAPNHLLLLTLLAETEIGANKFREAQKIIDQISQESEAVGQHLTGDLLLAQEKTDEALLSYEQSWVKQPNELLAGKLYTLYRGTQQGKKAIETLDVWVEKFPASPKALAARGSHLIAEKNYTKAIVDLEKAIEIVPESPVILNNLAWVQFELKNPQAEQTAAKAVKLAPESAPILDTYGWILFQKGKTQEALTYLEKALSLAPENAEIKAHVDAAKGK